MPTAVRAGLLYFACVFAAGFALGVLRTLWVEPAVGALWAVAAELPLILAFSWWVCRRLVAAFEVPARAGARACMGGLAFALLMAAELALGVAGDGPGEVLAGLGRGARLLGLAGQVAFALIPLAQARRSSWA